MIDGRNSHVQPDASSHRVITLFGDHDVIDDALSQEFGRRGRSVHAVSVSTGWLSSATLAVVRPDTPAGAVAMRELVHGGHPPSNVIAVCPLSADDQAVEQISELCRRCGAHHAVALIWHPVLDVASSGSAADEVSLPLEELASRVADTLDRSSATGTVPSFRSLTIQPA